MHRNTKNMRQTVLLITVLVSITGNIMSLPAFAAGTKEPGKAENAAPDGYDEEQWEMLQDNILEYEELGDRIKLFNPDMISANEMYCSAMDDVKDQYMAAYKDSRDYKDGAEDLKDEGGLSTKEGQTLYATLRAYEKAMKSAGDKISRAYKYNTRPDASSYEPVRKGEKQLTSGAQQAMIGYNMAAAQLKTLQTMEEMYGKLYSATVSMQNLGMATEADVTAAKKNLLNAESSLENLNNTVDSLGATLKLLTGWPAESIPQIQSISPVDLSKIEELNLQEDTAKAICNNYTLIDERHKKTDRSTTRVKSKFRNEEQTEQNLSIEIEQLYQEIMEKKKNYEAALTAYDQAVVIKNAAEIQLQNGSISQIEYLGQMLSYYQAEGEKTNADLSLRQAMELYYWATEGLLDI
ncbi:TolC family protein [Clostridium boliviensis]|uniref:TolC family protein n=1 Tax=Clostridium boliviensis TaxID=318465 RepID=A0ABU4GNF9_9CLOT|nr:TolC family protein [Clostridium boliviensis]MDW2798540.1 TolC family protein [Clostridium boliviensis]